MTANTTANLVTGFYTTLIGFACGIFTRSFYTAGLPEISFVLLISLGVGLVWRKNCNALFSSHILTVSVFLLFFAFGVLRMEFAVQSTVSSTYESLVESEVTLSGIVVREPDVRETSTHLYLKTEGETLLVFADPYGIYDYEDEIEVTGTLKRPEAFETDLGRTFNYPDYLHARGVSYIVRNAEIETIAQGEGNVILYTLLTAKHAFMNRIETLIAEPYVGLGEGLLLGVKRALGEELEGVFRETGIIHIVVLSGYNIMLVVVFVTYVLGAILPRSWQLPFGVAAIAAFAFLVGLSATVVRASVMAGLFLIARATNHTYMVLRALILAGATMLLMNPYLLAFDVGFQLSFVATLGLILLAPHIESLLSFVPTFAGMREFLTATIATQIFVSPILLYQIGQFSIVAVFVNVLVLPMVPTAMLLTFLTGMIGFVSTTLAGVLSVFTYLSLLYIIEIARFFAALPFASYTVPQFPFWVVIVSYMFLGYLLWRSVHKIEKDDELAGWTIEDEDALQTKLAASSKDTASGTPVFFR